MGNQALALTDMTDEKLGQLIAQSGYFQDAKQAGQAVVKVIAGREIGLGPIASMTGIYIVQGRVAFGANVMAAALKRTGRYTYRVTELTDDKCSIEFFEIIGGKRESLGTSTFTKQDAAKAQTKNMEKFPKNMLFARAMSNGVKWYTPDVFAGAPVYTPEELGAEVNEDGDVIDARPIKPEHATDVKAEQKPGLDTDDKRAKTAALYEALRQDAAALEIMSEPSEAFGTTDDLIRAGKELRAAINQKTVKNGAH